jgi:hypothetical protein
MSEIVNLRRARKEKVRGAKEKDAAGNRAKHGVAKSLRSVVKAQAKKSEHDLNAHKLDNEN